MRALLFALALLVPSLAPAAAPPKPFSAEYEVFQNDEKLGTGTITLRALGGGRFELTTVSEATEGLFAAAGIRREERSVNAGAGCSRAPPARRHQRQDGRRHGHLDPAPFPDRESIRPRVRFERSAVTDPTAGHGSDPGEVNSVRIVDYPGGSTAR